MSGDRWIAFAAVSVAVCALGLSIYEARQSREYLARSTRPLFFVTLFYAEETAGFKWGNAGLGPGELHWFSVEVDKVPQPDWLSMFRTLGFARRPVFSFAVPGRGRWIKPGEDHWILKVEPGPVYDELVAKSDRIGAGGCYCSMFDECWIFSRLNDKQQVESCAPAPEIVFRAPPN